MKKISEGITVQSVELMEGNTEKVVCKRVRVSNLRMSWGEVEEFSFAARVGTYRVGDRVTIDFQLRDREDER